MRKLITASLVIALLISACGGGSDNDSDGLATSADEPTAVATTAPPTTATVEPTTTTEPTVPPESTNTPEPTATTSVTPPPTPTTTPKLEAVAPIGDGESPTSDIRILGNLTYTSSYSDTGTVTLSDGAWESEPIGGGVTTTKSRLYLAAVGALNADAEVDAAAVLVTDPGGSGTFFDLYAVDGATHAVVGPANLGDRIRNLEVTISDGNISASFLERDGTERSDVYVVGDGVLERTDAPFPLVREFEASGCFVAGESEFTIDYLGDSSTLIACADAVASNFDATHDAELVHYVLGYSLFTIARAAVDIQTFEVGIGGSDVFTIDGTCRITNGILTLDAEQQGPNGPDIVRSLQITADVAKQTGSIDYGSIDAVIEAEVAELTTTDAGFELSGVSTTGLDITVRGTCRF